MTGAGFAPQRRVPYDAGILSTADSAEPRAEQEPGRSAGPDPAMPHQTAASISNRRFASSQATSDFMESLRLLAAGGVAGAVSKTATAPLARLTILYQVHLLYCVGLMTCLFPCLGHSTGFGSLCRDGYCSTRDPCAPNGTAPNG